jgi:hypothetical protein
MFAYLARLMRNFGLRRRIAYARFRQAWRWFTGQLRIVRRWIIVDLAVTVTAIALAVWFQSNKPARYALAICLLIEIGLISMRLVLPILGIELGSAIADRTVRKVDSWWDTLRGNIPWWASWIVGKPGEPEHHPPAVHVIDHHRHPDAVWHDVSVGGHVFHIIGTIAMWKNVLLLEAALFPIWEKDWLSASVMLTVFIILFVWTEDFVNIKVWRRRLGYVMTTVAILYIGAMAFRTLAPGWYKLATAKFEYKQDMSERLATGVDEDKKIHMDRLTRLLQQKRDLEIRYNEHVDHSLDPSQPDGDWTVNSSNRLKSVTERIEEMQSSSLETSDEGSVTAYFDPLYLAATGLVLFVIGFVGTPLLRRS